MDALLQVFILGLLVESIVETIEWVIEREFLRQRLEALLAAELLAFTSGANIFTLANLDATGPLGQVAPIIGTALAGLLLSRGANFVHDLLERMRGGVPASALRAK